MSSNSNSNSNSSSSSQVGGVVSPMDAAVARLAQFPPELPVSIDQRLALYALFKQARNGDAPADAWPSRFDVKGYAKFKAWAALAGTARHEAEAQYVALVHSLDPTWEPPAAASNGDRLVVVEVVAVTPVKDAPPPSSSSSSSNNNNHNSSSSNTTTTTNNDQGESQTGGRPPLHPPAPLLAESAPPKRRQSLDQNFFSASRARLSNTLEKVLFNGSLDADTTQTSLIANVSSFSPSPSPPTLPESEMMRGGTRPRGLSLDVSFVVSPFAPLQEVAKDVKRLVSSPHPASAAALASPAPSKNRSATPSSSPAAPAAAAPPSAPPAKRMVWAEAWALQNRVLNHFDTVGNARHFGGMPALTHEGKRGVFRSNLLFRAAHFDEATERDARWCVETYNLRTIIDLRGQEEMLGPLSTVFVTTRVPAQVGELRKVNDRVRVLLPLLSRRTAMESAKSKMNLGEKLWAAYIVVHMLVFGFVRKLVAALPLLGPVFSGPLREVEHRFEQGLRMLVSRSFAKAGLKSLYVNILRHGHAELRPALMLASDPANLPLAFHCTFGKDRTGLLAVCLLHAAGVSREDILRDYEASSAYIDTDRGRAEWEGVKVVSPFLHALPEEWGRSARETMQDALEEVEKEHGSLDAYLSKVLKLDETWTRKIRQIYVAPEGEGDQTQVLVVA